MPDFKTSGKYCIHKIVYQPVLNLHYGRVCKLEALSRFFNFQGQSLPVIDVITDLENTGNIKRATYFLIDSIIAFLARSHGKKISFNLSHYLLGDYEIIDYVINKCLQHSLSGSHIEVEINENISSSDLINHLDFLQYIKACGLQIALDDFGVGVLQEKDLLNYKFDTIKIDRSVVSGIGQSKSKYDRFLQMLFLCLESGAEVICEGIENTEDLNMIPGHEKISIQGFVFSRPLSEENLKKFLRQSKFDLS